MSVRPTRQRRSRRTLERLADATVELMGERPFEAIAVDEIVARAGTSKGAFYYRFESKAALLEHLNGQLFDDALERWSRFLDPAAWAGSSLRAFLDAFAERLVEIYSARAPLMRALVREARRGEPLVVARVRELNDHVLRGFIGIVDAHRDEAEHPDPCRAAGVALTALATLLPALLLDADDVARMVIVDARVAKEEVQRLLAGYLGVKGGGVPG